MDNEYIVKEYFQDILLSAIYNSIQEADLLVFKGGTAIRKIYGIDRYSDDLDFSLNDKKLTVPADDFIYDLRDKCIAMLSPLYDAKMHIHGSQMAWYHIDAALKDNASRSAKIHIEISTGKIYRACLEKRVITPDTTYFASVMDINEIISEKIRAVYTRRNVENTARDMVDIAFLIARGGKFDLKLADEKLKEVKHKPFSISTFSARMHLVTDSVWRKDLGKIMKEVPDRGKVVKQVTDFIKKA
jgi:predicted nucleotidyltransferase component of viral defense system